MRFLSVLTLALLLSGFASAQPIGEKLPEFTFQTLDNESVSLSTLREQSSSGVLLMTFWCTTCASCRATEDSLAWVMREYGPEAKVVAIASSKDDTAETIEAYLAQHGKKLVVLLDPQSQLAHHLDVHTTTTTIVLDGDGRLRYFGTLKRGKRFFALEPLKEVLAGKIVGQPRGPKYG